MHAYRGNLQDLYFNLAQVSLVGLWVQNDVQMRSNQHCHYVCLGVHVFLSLNRKSAGLVQPLSVGILRG